MSTLTEQAQKKIEEIRAEIRQLRQVLAERPSDAKAQKELRNAVARLRAIEKGLTNLRQ